MAATPEQAPDKQPPDEALNAAPETPEQPSSDEADMAPSEQMTDEELRLMADTMPGEGPGGD